MKIVKHPIILIVTFLWVGFVGAISFLQAWIKFRAPGVTIPIGLGIGRLVFSALNKVEWFFAIIIGANLLISKTRFFSIQNTLYFIAVLLLLLQSFWILPLLDARAELIIEGKTLPTSYLHFYYVGMEVVKIACLLLFGIKLFKKT